MVNRLFPAALRLAGLLICASLGLIAAAGILFPASAQAQGGLFHHRKAQAPTEQSKPAPDSSQPAAFSIPVEPLGFFAPGAIYQGQRESLASLDFVDEDHLLFTFHAPGLIRREGDSQGQDERQIRAVLLTLPLGTVAAEALWTVHDRGRYLWMLNDGHFFLRDQNDLQLGDASLELKPSLHFQGPVLWLEMNPSQQLLATDSREPDVSSPPPGDVPSPATAAASVTTDNPKPGTQPDIVLRIMRRTSGQVMLVSRVRSTVHLPINSDGYLEVLRSRGHEWILNMNYFTGGSRVVGKVDSMCAPSLEFISDPEVLVTTCNPDNSRWMIAMSTDGKRLWNAAKPHTQIWPRLVMAPNGLRAARETILVSHPIDAFSPLSFDDVKGQLVEVYDAADGKVELTAAANPVLDGGGNLAISPSGRRVAVLDAGAIQVYELPAPPPLPQPGVKPAAR